MNYIRNNGQLYERFRLVKTESFQLIKGVESVCVLAFPPILKIPCINLSNACASCFQRLFHCRDQKQEMKVWVFIMIHRLITYHFMYQVIKYCISLKNKFQYFTNEVTLYVVLLSINRHVKRSQTSYGIHTM